MRTIVSHIMLIGLGERVSTAVPSISKVEVATIAVYRPQRLTTIDSRVRSILARIFHVGMDTRSIGRTVLISADHSSMVRRNVGETATSISIIDIPIAPKDVGILHGL